MAHLYTDAPAPAEYIELILCRDLYHCDPLRLPEIPLEKIIAHLICRAEEAKWLNDKHRK